MAAGTAFLSAVFLFAAEPVRAYAPNPAVRQSEEQISIQVEYGLKNTVYPNSRYPVTVKLDGHGMEFSGVLKCSYTIREYPGGAAETVLGSLLAPGAETAGSREILREIPVEIKSKEPWQVTFFSLMDYNDTEYTFTLEDALGNTVSVQEITIMPKNSGNDYVVAVIGEDAELAGLIQSYQWPSELLAESVELSVMELEPVELTAENLNQDMPDAVIFSGEADEALSVSQLMTLEAWESRGGLLVEEAGAENVLELFDQAIRQSDVNHLLQRAYGGSISSDYAGYVIRNMPVRGRPNLVVYIVLLAVYAIFAGPGLYLILKKLHRRYYLWTGMLAMSLAAVVFIWSYSSHTRIRAPFISYVETIRQGEKGVQECVEFGIQAPFNSSFDLYTDTSCELVPWGMQSGGWSDQELNPDFLGRIRIQRQEEKRRVTISGFPAFTMTGYSLMKNTVDPPGDGIESRLRIVDGAVEGTIVNHTEYRIINAALLMPGGAVWIGELDAGERLSLGGLSLEPVNEVGRQEFYRSHAVFTDETLAEFETEVWESAAGRTAFYNAKDSILVGMPEGRTAAWQMNSGYESHGYSYYIAPANVELQADGTLFCPYAHQYRSDDATPYAEGRAVTSLYFSGDEYTATYHLNDLLEKDAAGRLEVEQLSFREMTYIEEYAENFDGRIDLYNYHTEKFDSLDSGQRTLEKGFLKPYLNENNELIVRYLKADMGTEAETSSLLPCLWVSGKVVPDAEN